MLKPSLYISSLIRMSYRGSPVAIPPEYRGGFLLFSIWVGFSTLDDLFQLCEQHAHNTTTTPGPKRPDPLAWHRFTS